MPYLWEQCSREAEHTSDQCQFDGVPLQAIDEMTVAIPESEAPDEPQAGDSSDGAPDGSAPPLAHDQGDGDSTTKAALQPENAAGKQPAGGPLQQPVPSSDKPSAGGEGKEPENSPAEVQKSGTVEQPEKISDVGLEGTPAKQSGDTPAQQLEASVATPPDTSPESRGKSKGAPAVDDARKESGDSSSGGGGSSGSDRSGGSNKGGEAKGGNFSTDSGDARTDGTHAASPEGEALAASHSTLGDPRV